MPGRMELLNLKTLVPWLNKSRLLTQEENYDLLKDTVAPTERAIALLYLILPSKGPGAYRKFIACIQEETQHAGHRHLAQLLTQKLCT